MLLRLSFFSFIIEKYISVSIEPLRSRSANQKDWARHCQRGEQGKDGKRQRDKGPPASEGICCCRNVRVQSGMVIKIIVSQIAVRPVVARPPPYRR